MAVKQVKKRSTNTEQQTVYNAAAAEWPGGFGIYKESKQVVNNNLSTIAILLILSIATGFFSNSERQDAAYAIGSSAAFIVSALLSIALIIVLLASAEKRKVSLIDSLSEAMSFWLRSIVLTILLFLAYAASIVLLIIPFFFVFPRLALAPYYLVDKHIGAYDAIKASWRNTKGHVGKVYGITGVNIVFALLMITIIGIPFSIYFIVMYSAASALLYKYIEAQPKSAA